MKHIKSATDYGWEVRSSDAMKALDMWVEAVGEEKALEDIAYAMGDDELRDNIEYIAEQWEFTDLIEDIDNTWGKYEETKEVMGVTELLNSLTSAMGYDELAECLAYIFRQHDFREWDEIESSRKPVKSGRTIGELAEQYQDAIYDLEDYFGVNSEKGEFYLGRRLTDSDYIEGLDDICRKHNIRFEPLNTDEFTYHIVKNSRKPVKSSLMDEVMNFETTEDLNIYLKNKGYERRDGNGFFEYGIPNQPAELRVTEDGGGFIVDIKALTNSRKINSVRVNELTEQEKDDLYEIEKNEAEEHYNSLDDSDKRMLRLRYGIKNVKDYVKFFIVHPNKLSDDYEFMNDPRAKLNSRQIKSSRKPIKSSTNWKIDRLIKEMYDLHYITEEDMNNALRKQYTDKDINKLERYYTDYKNPGTDWNVIRDIIKDTVNIIKSSVDGYVYSDSLNKMVPKRFKYKNKEYFWYDPDCLYWNTEDDEDYFMEIPEGAEIIQSSHRLIKSGYKISPLEWANKWIPEVYDQRKFIQLCEQKGISKIDSDEFFKLMDEFGFKSNGKTFEYDASKYLYDSRKITSGLDPYLCCPNCGEPELFENIKENNIKCYNCGNTISYDELKNLKRYISPHSKIKSARYIATDPESGEVLGSADTYEEAVNEWGEDVRITDSMAIKSNANLSGEVYHWVVNAGALDELSEDERNDYMACAEHIASKIDNPEEFGYSDKTPEDANRFVRAIAYELQHNKSLIDSGCDKVEPVSPSRPVPKNLPPYKDNSENKKKKEENKDGKSFADMLKEEQEKQKANSSKQSNHEFYTNIVSSLLSKDITEDQAVEQIASRNNVNKGYAKHILNSIVNDNQYIKSGIMDIADDINKEVNLNDELDTWAETYIKDTGKSNTLAGEILRAYKQIEYRWFNDGDKIGIGYGKETVNPAARFLVEKCTGWTEVANIEEMLSGDSDINSDNDSYNEWVEDAKYSLEDYLRNNDDWFHTPNKQDMWESSTEDDKDTSVNECYIMDDNSNEYWFYNRDGWVCTGVTYYNDQQFDVGDVLDEDDVNNYISEPDDDFADFEDDSGFEYSAENNDGEWSITDVRIPEALAEEGDRWDISDFEDYDIYDPNGNEISIKDLY